MVCGLFCNLSCCCCCYTAEKASDLRDKETALFQILAGDYECVQWLSGMRVVRVRNELQEDLVCRAHASIARANREKKILRRIASGSFPILAEDYRLTKCVLMVYTPGSSLFENLVERRANYSACVNLAYLRKIVVHLLRALSFLHSLFIVHLDVKSTNILITAGGNVKLIDFEFARELSNHTLLQPLDRSCGTVGFIAPEVYRKQVCLDSDMWSVGMLITQCLFQRDVVQPEYYLSLLTSPEILTERALALWAQNRCHYVDLASIFDDMQKLVTRCLQRHGSRASSRVGLRLLTEY